MIIHIVAVDRNRVINDSNPTLWSTNVEKDRLETKVRNKVVIMGRNTFERVGKVDVASDNIVLSQTPENIQVLYNTPGIHVVQSLDEAIAAGRGNSDRDVYIVGGVSLFDQTMHVVETVHLTVLGATLSGDSFYPELPGFRVTARSTIYGGAPNTVQFLSLTREPTFK